MSNKLPDNPCWGCSNREVGCHCDCIKYRAWRLASDIQAKHIREQKLKSYDARAIKIENILNWRFKDGPTAQYYR